MGSTLATCIIHATIIVSFEDKDCRLDVPGALAFKEKRFYGGQDYDIHVLLSLVNTLEFHHLLNFRRAGREAPFGPVSLSVTALFSVLTLLHLSLQHLQ